MEASNKIKICIVGFTAKGANGVEYFINKRARTKYNFQIVKQISNDVIVLVDGDTIDGQVFLKDTQSSQHQLLVAQFKKSPDCGLPWLKKPIVPVELVDKLIEIAEQSEVQTEIKKPITTSQSLNHKKLSSALAGKQVASEIVDNKVPTETVNFYTPGNYIQGVIMRCIKKATTENPYIQAHFPFGDLVLDVNERKVYVLIGKKDIRSYEKSRLTRKVMLRVIPNINEVQNMVKPDQVQPLDDLLWNSSIAASIGRLPQGTDVDKPMSLKCWPNLTKVHKFDFATQIAAMWSQNTLSIREVIEKTGIKHNFVYVFFAAAHALDLMVSETSNVIELNGKDKPVINQSIMARLLSHLKKAS